MAETNAAVNSHGGPPRSLPSWLRNHSALVTWLIAAAQALCFALSFPPVNVWPLMPVSIALLTIAAVGARRGLTVALAVGLAQIVMWLVLAYWVMAVTAVGYPLKAVGMTTFTLGYVFFVRILHAHRPCATWPFTLLVPIVWTGVECFRGEIAFNGYPWYFAAHPFIAFPAWTQSADVLGTYFISFLVAAVGGALVDFMRAWRRGIRLSCGIALFVLGVAISVNLGYGFYRLSQKETLSPGLRIAAIQTNLPQENKVGWGPQQQDHDLPGFIGLTRGAARAAREELGGADLIVWPETMLPGVGFEPDVTAQVARFGTAYDHMVRWQREVTALAGELGTPMLVGSLAWTEPTIDHQGDMVSLAPRHRYNSAYLIQGELPYQRYDKFFLTPFGETMPYISDWPWLEEQLLALGANGMSFDLDTGSSLAPLTLDVKDSEGGPARRITFGTPICFEDSVAWVCRRMVYEGGVKRADMLINMSNDGWFGESDKIRALHLQVARFRCIENRVPMVRSVNTGLSAAIDSCGRIVGTIGDGATGTPRREGWLVTKVVLDGRNSFYGRVGDVWAFGCAIAVVGMLLATYVLRKGGST